MKTITFLKYAFLIAIALPIAFATSCSEDENTIVETIDTVVVTETEIVEVLEKYNTPKYIFYFIGDGMSSPQINLAEVALKSENFKRSSKKAEFLGSLNLRKFPVTGMQTTHAEDRYITGSAASATAMATGYKTKIGYVGVDGEGKNLKTMAEMAKEKGMKVGIVSSVSIDHATPACFYAHTDSRNKYDEIDEDLVKSGFDYFAGGGVRYNKYNGTIDEFKEAATANGYTYVNTKAAFDALNAESGKTIATLKRFATNTSDGCALPYVMDLDEIKSEDDKITLTDFTRKGIEVLDNDKGFFMMVEGGKIDWACHANDAVAATHNTVEFDLAIAEAIEFYEEHPEETLIVVTGDHECGGLTLGYAATGYNTTFDLLDQQKVSYNSFATTVSAWEKTKTFESALEDVKTNFGLGNEGLELSEYETGLLKTAFDKSIGVDENYDDDNLTDEEKRIYGGYDPFTVTVIHTLNNKAGIDFTSYKHTATPVPVFAMGQGQYEFNGYYDNTDIAKRIIKIAKLAE